MRVALALVIGIVIGGLAVFLLLRDSDDADLLLTGSTGTETFDGVDTANNSFERRRFTGEGTVAMLVSVRNARDEPLRLGSGTGADSSYQVGFVPTEQEGVLLNRFRLADLEDEIPAGASGVIVHTYELRCRGGDFTQEVDAYELEVSTGGDPHPAQVEVTLSDDEFELRPYEIEASDMELVFEPCE